MDNTTWQNDINIQEADICPEDATMDAHPPSSLSLESVNFQMHGPMEDRMHIAFLCNPNDKDSNVVRLEFCFE